MTDTIPPPENPPSPPQASMNPTGQHEPRQKHSFRRRRKRRSQGQGQGQSQNSSQPAGNNSQGTPGGPRNDHQPRKHKKRFFKKKQHQGQSQGQGQPRNERGNSHGNGQQRRGGKQRKSKVFVGPMDHSYRAVNGNYADAPPATIDLQRGMGGTHFNGNGNGNGNYNGNYAGPQSGSAELFEGAAGSPLNDDSPVRIYCFIDDLFFIAKIQETARKLAIKVAFVKNEKDTVADLLALPDEERPALIVVDLNNANAKPLALISKLKQKLKRATSVVGFLSHLQGELKVKALEAGCDTVMPRSAFSQTLPNLLRRYGVEVELEDDQQRFAEI